MAGERAYLSVLSWPAGMDEAQRIDVCRKYLDADAYRAKEWSRRHLPAMFKRESLERAARIVQELAPLGVEALATSKEDLKREEGSDCWVRIIERLRGGEAYRISMCEKPGSIPVETELDPRKIICLIRAHARLRAKLAHTGDTAVSTLHHMQGTFSAQDWDQGPTSRSSLTLVEILDIATRDGLRLRIVGGRCEILSIEFPHAEAGLIPRATLDALAEQLIKDSGRGVEIDKGFDSARFLAEFAPDFDVRGEWRCMEGFDLYSAWLYRITRSRIVNK